MSTVNIELSLLTIPLQTFISELCYNSRWLYLWDKNTGSLVCVQTRKELMTPFNVINVASLAAIQCCCLYLIIGKGVMDTTSISLGYIFFTTILWLLNLMILGTLFGVYKDRFALVEFANNWMIEAKIQFFTQEKPCQNVQNLKDFLVILIKELVKVSKTGKGDFLGILITVLSVGLLLAQLLPPLLALVEIDVFGQAAVHLYPPNKRSFVGNLISRTITVSLTTITTLETMRTLRMFLLCILVIGQIGIKLLDKLKILQDQDPKQALQEYKRIYLMHNTCRWISTVVVCVTVQVGALITIFACTGTIVGRRLLDSQLSQLYVLVPLIAAGAIFIASAALPMTQKTVERSEEMIEKWKRDPNILGGQLVINKRILRTLRPIGFPMAGYGILDRDYNHTYWNKIMTNTIDSCLMIISITK